LTFEGAYTHSQGILSVRQSVAKFIEKRDGHPSNAKRIFLTNGASSGIQLILNSIIRNEKDCVMKIRINF
jgi:aspartate/methionine/tyrosine aminotransferase